MKLKAYLKQRKIKYARFANVVGVSVEAMRRYVNGLRIPHRYVMNAIVSHTNGLVTPSDFYSTPKKNRASSPGRGKTSKAGAVRG